MVCCGVSWRVGIFSLFFLQKSAVRLPKVLWLGTATNLVCGPSRSRSLTESLHSIFRFLYRELQRSYTDIVPLHGWALGLWSVCSSSGGRFFFVPHCLPLYGRTLSRSFGIHFLWQIFQLRVHLGESSIRALQLEGRRLLIVVAEDSLHSNIAFQCRSPLLCGLCDFVVEKSSMSLAISCSTSAGRTPCLPNVSCRIAMMFSLI